MINRMVLTISNDFPFVSWYMFGDIHYTRKRDGIAFLFLKNERFECGQL